jgi:hypothetical protein
MVGLRFLTQHVIYYFCEVHSPLHVQQTMLIVHIGEFISIMRQSLLELGSWWQMFGKTKAITNHYQSTMEDWNLAIEEFHVARISLMP